jgi:hypothetical protein
VNFLRGGFSSEDKRVRKKEPGERRATEAAAVIIDLLIGLGPE